MAIRLPTGLYLAEPFQRVRARTATMTRLAPACLSARAAAPQVAPVVRMSSTSRMVRPFKPGSGRARKACRMASMRSEAALCARRSVALIRRRGWRTRRSRGRDRPLGQSLGLVVTALQPPPPVQGNRHDPGIARQPGEFALPGFREQVAQPGGQPGIALVFQPQAEVAE